MACVQERAEQLRSLWEQEQSLQQLIGMAKIVKQV